MILLFVTAEMSAMSCPKEKVTGNGRTQYAYVLPSIVLLWPLNQSLQSTCSRS